MNCDVPPDFLAFGIAAYDTVNDRRLAGLGVRILFANGVNLNVLRIIYVDKLFVNIRAIGTRMV